MNSGFQPVSRDNYQRAEIISGMRSGAAVAIRVAPNRCLHRPAEKLSKPALPIARWQGFGKGSLLSGSAIYRRFVAPHTRGRRMDLNAAIFQTKLLRRR